MAEQESHFLDLFRDAVKISGLPKEEIREIIRDNGILQPKARKRRKSWQNFDGNRTVFP